MQLYFNLATHSTIKTVELLVGKRSNTRSEAAFMESELE